MGDLPLSGYQSAHYAATLSWLGSPQHLTKSGGYVLIRSIPSTEFSDAIGCYPFFSCQHWRHLREDIANQLQHVVSVTIVTDPFGEDSHAELAGCFDFVVPFKRHAIVHLGDMERPPSAHHQRRLVAARKQVVVTREEHPVAIAKVWVQLYAHLSARHKMSALAAFPPHALEKQLAVPGIRVFRGNLGEQTACVTLWYVQGDVAYYHLGASSADGYRASASYAVFDAAFAALAQEGVRMVDLGAGPDNATRPTTESLVSGLERFKMGWASETRDVFLCGRIVQRNVYDELTQGRGRAKRAYFPSYRNPS